MEFDINNYLNGGYYSQPQPQPQPQPVPKDAEESDTAAETSTETWSDSDQKAYDKWVSNLIPITDPTLKAEFDKVVKG